MKQQKGSGKKRRALPSWLQRFRLDRRLQMACLFAVAVAGILFVLNRYHVRYIRNLDYDSTAVVSREVFDDLKQGTAEIGNTVWLPHFAADEPVYRRGGHYYIGEDYARVEDGAPLFVNQGTYANLISGDGNLINAQWEEEAAIAGMYLSNGQSFNFDGTMIEDEEIFFLHMSNGLYLNTKELYLNGPQQKFNIPTNSFLHITEDGIRYYARQDGEKMIYGLFSQIYGASVEIGGQSMSYTEFLEKLGLLKEELPGREETIPETETQTEPETAMESGSESAGETEETESIKPVPEEESPQPDATESEGQGRREGQEENFSRRQQEESSRNGDDLWSEIPDTLDRDRGNGSHDWGDLDNGQNGNQSSENNSGNIESSGSTESSGSSGGTESSGSTEGGNGGSGSGSAEGGNGSSGSGSGSTEDGSGSTEDSSGSTEESSGSPESSSGSAESTGAGSGTLPPTEPTSGSGGIETPIGPATGNNASRPGDGSGEGTGGGEGDSSGDGTGSGSGSGPGQVIPWSKPEVSLSELEIDIYSALGTLDVTDKAGTFSRVSLTLSWDTEAVGRPDANTPIQYRRTLKSAGDFQIDNLPPGTWIYLQAYLQYYDENGKRVRETEPFRTVMFRTEPFDRVDHIYIRFSDNINDSEEGRYYENQVSAYNLHLSSTNGYLLEKVYRGTLTAYGQDGSETVFNLSSNALRRFKLSPQDYISLLSQGTLPPNQEYRYRFELWDRFGNSFLEADKIYWGQAENLAGTDNFKAMGYDREGTSYKPENGARWDAAASLGSGRFWGYTHTSKTIPAAEVKIIPSSVQNKDSLSKVQFSVAVKDIHQALVEGAGTVGGTGIGGVIGGTPSGGDKNYKLYYGIYSNEKGTAAGNELKTTAVLSNGKIVIKEDPSGSPYHYLDDASLPGGDSDSLLYEVEELTAGETYMVRIFGVYNLNDNYGAVEKELGSMRFSTITLSSYGRVYYSFSSSHIKTPQPVGVESYDHSLYESATAQKITMTINTARTNATLAKEYYNDFILNLQYRRDSGAFLQLKFNKEQLERSEITVNDSQLDPEDGSYVHVLRGGLEGAAGSGYEYRYQINNVDMNGKLPEVAMRIPVRALPDSIKRAAPQGDGTTSYTFNLWDAFLSVDSVTDGQSGAQNWVFAGGSDRTALELTFEDNTLNSFTSYVLASESHAKQGAIEDHNITASSNAYRQCGFTTLKEMPFVTIGGILQVGRYLYLVDIRLHDPDQSIYQGQTHLNNVNLTASNATATLSEVLDYSSDRGGMIARAEFGSLRIGADYELRVAPVDIRRTGGTAQPRIQNVSLYEYNYTAGRGVSGNIFLSGITYPLKELSENGNYRTISDYNKYEVGNFDYGTMAGTEGGPLTITDTTNGTVGVMQAISVNPGQVYYLHNLAGNSEAATASAAASIAFLDVNENLAGPLKTIYGDSYIQIPDGVRYMRVSVSGTRSTGGRTGIVNLSQAQAILIYDEEDSVLVEKLKMVSDPVGPVKSGNTYTYNFGSQELVGRDAIALTSGDWAGSGDGRFSVRYVFKDGNGSTISTQSENVYSGYVKGIPSGTASAEVAVTVSLNGSGGRDAVPHVRMINTGRVKAFSQYLFDTLIASYQAEVYDYAGSLTDLNSGEVKLEVEVRNSNGQSEGILSGAGLTGRVSSYINYPDGRRDGYYQGNNNFETTNGYTYRLKLSVRWRGDYYTLDEQEFTAQGNEYSIATGKQLLKLVTWPTGRFLVIDDLGIIDSRTLAYLNQTFYGHLNGQGHSLEMTITGGGGFIPTLGNAAVLENLDITETLGNSNTAMTYVYPIGTNRGTIRNVVFHMTTGRGNYRHTDVAGICRANQGIIENFALYFTYPSESAGNYMSNASGGVTSYNSGIIRNGVVYGARTLDVTTGVWGGSEEIGLSSVGGVAGNNMSGGSIERVMVIMNMRVERNANVLTQEAVFGSYGLIAGSNSGMVRDCFTNGDITYGYWELNSSNVYQQRFTSGNNKIAWPGGNYSASSRVRNSHYFAGGRYLEDNENVSYQNSTMALRSSLFYGSTVNREGNFVVESQLEGGYYPIVDMPDCMTGTQSNIPLAAAFPGGMPTYISTSAMKLDGKELRYLEGETIPAATVAKIKGMVDDKRSISWDTYFTQQTDGSAVVTKQFAVASMAISNRIGYILDNVRVKDLTATVMAEKTSGEICDLTVLLTPYLGTTGDSLVLSSRPTSFTSSYQVESFEYGYETNSMTTVNLTDAYFALDFFYPLSGETWGQIQGGTGLERMNFRMVDDIDFDLKSDGGSFEAALDLNRALEFFNNQNNNSRMGGIFDGNHYTLDFRNRNVGSFYFREISAGGQVKDVTVENLRLETANAEYKGFIRRAEQGSSLSGIHMRNTVLNNAYQYAGALAGYVSTTTVENCTVTGGSIKSGTSTSGLYAGGMIGYRDGVGMTRNSFVSGLDMSIMDGISVNGVGGMFGGQYAASTVAYAQITSCYAQGRIQTAFANCGGLVGRGNGQISAVWTAVDIIGTNNIGSLIGYARASDLNNLNSYSSAVVSGELYSSTQGISRRLVGVWERTPITSIWTYAYEGQLLNSNTSRDVMDVTEVTDAETMMSYYYWTDIVGIGKGFCLYGSEEQNIGDVSQAPVYPILYATDGETLLPDQTETPYKVTKPVFEVVEASAKERADTSEYGNYDITIKVKIGGTLNEGELKGALSADGLIFDNAAITVEGTGTETDADGNTVTVTMASITGADAVKRLDSYRLDYAYDTTGHNIVSTKLEFKDDSGQPVYLYWKIDSPQKWRTKMAECGTQYENFMITGNINLTGISVENLKLNRLTGAKKPANYDNRSTQWTGTPEFYSLSNARVNGYGMWITEVATYLGYLDIRGCTITGTLAADKFGLIGNIVGDVEYVDFSNDNVITGSGTGTYNYLGCIGYIGGYASNVRISNVGIASRDQTFYYSNVGGLAGYVKGLNNICGRDIHVQMGNDANISRNYFGGIAGYVPAEAHNIYGEYLEVLGRNSTGGLIGWLYQSTTTETVMEKPDMEAVSVKVTGNSNVGGAVGYISSYESNMRVMGAEVHARASNAGGVIGYSWYGTGYNQEVYESTITAAGDSAGGICGSGVETVGRAKAANCTVKADGNYAGGIVGSGHTVAIYNAVYGGSVEANAYAGGIIGRLVNSNNSGIGTHHNIYRNVVSGTKVRAESRYAGGIAGGICGALVYENEVTDATEVDAQTISGGLVGYSSGNEIHHNIIGGTVTGNSNVGGLAGETQGYGISFSAGSTMLNSVAKAYGNVIACKEIKATGNYAAGLIGLYTPGSEPVDGDGNVIENSGYVDHMTRENFYGNAILAGNISAGGVNRQSWYANYMGDNQHYTRQEPNPRYDSVIETLYSGSGNAARLRIPDISQSSTVKEDAVIRVLPAILGTKEFYVNSFANGGLGFAEANLDLSGLKNYYPYIGKMNNYPIPLVPYQNQGGLPAGGRADWNTYYKKDGGTWKEVSFDGAGISNPAATSGINLKSVARGIVYPSGIDTVNIDFGSVDTGFVTFEIPGLLEETSIDTFESSAWTCSMKYDYKTDFVLNLYSLDHSEKVTYSYHAADLRSTIMSWNRKNYYLRSDGVYHGMEDGSSACVLEGEFVNLYEGKALDADGQAYPLSAGSQKAGTGKEEE